LAGSSSGGSNNCRRTSGRHGRFAVKQLNAEVLMSSKREDSPQLQHNLAGNGVLVTLMLFYCRENRAKCGAIFRRSAGARRPAGGSLPRPALKALTACSTESRPTSMGRILTAGTRDAYWLPCPGVPLVLAAKG
jgi:hypothetical protein